MGSYIVATDGVMRSVADTPRGKARLAALRFPDPLGGGRMQDRVNGVAELKTRTAGHRFIEGWVEGPCAESADLRGINRLMTDFVDDAVYQTFFAARPVETSGQVQSQSQA